MNLVIVESPAKAKTINKYLGKDYKVLASYGHIRQLPSKPGSVDPDADFAMSFEVSPGATKHVKEMIAEAKKAKSIILATDPDREGEGISWHVIEALKDKKALNKDIIIKRIAFSEISKKAITEALKNARDVDINLVNAQKARQALDYLVGFTLSPLLWKKLPGCKSAGRVQSVALRLICEREEEIDKFRSEEYWDIIIKHLSKNNKEFDSRLIYIGDEKLKKFSINNENQASDIATQLAKQNFTIRAIEKKLQKRNPYPPFITSTLQQEASRKLGFGAKKTMQIAQKLYEGLEIDKEVVSLITYMRTDGVTLSQEAINSSRDYINKNFGIKYLPKSPRIYKSKAKNAQEAHEAIRPVNVNIIPKNIETKIDKDYLRLYELIWKRTIACQMSPLEIDMVAVTLVADKNAYTTRSNGSRIAFDGFYKVYKENIDDKSEETHNMLPELHENDRAPVKEVLPKQHFTEPPPRYSEASLVKNLEERGIGRPSTYASIISVIQDREYVKLEKKRFYPDDKGRILNAFLVNYFTKYVEYDFTANLENELDKIANHELDWKDLLRHFWKDFSVNIESSSQYEIKSIIESLEKILEYHLFPEQTNDSDPRKCPSCDGGRVGLRLGKFGAFLSCNSYPECKYTKQIIKNTNDDQTDSSGNNSKENVVIGQDQDGKSITLRQGPYGKYLQLGEQEGKVKPKRASIPLFLVNAKIDLAMAQKLLSLPLVIGMYNKHEVKVGIGRYGPYILCNKKFISIPKQYSPLNLTIDEAEEIIANYKPKKKST